MPSLARLAALLGGLVFCVSATAADVDAQSYGYPLANPFEATIATTPPELRPALPDDRDIDQSDYSVRLRPDREFELLDNFWPVTKLQYRLAEQKGRAPLIFIISGTGASYASSITEYLKKLFYGAGFHVVQLSSPTSYDFMAAASRFATPGYSPDDADDLYRAMQAVRALQYGETYINRENFEAMQGFHAGRRKSGIGGADGKHGLYEFMETHVVYMQHG